MLLAISTACGVAPSFTANASSSLPGDETVSTLKPRDLMYAACPRRKLRDMGTVKTWTSFMLAVSSSFFAILYPRRI
jgi:hypothetical protein